ncbi:putative E3 ubiquitin-protein ligase [Myotisia sp. PD_48]|nr:putative E3 ubiquitin-protein ligase [Myotisia sp. PD_48]
MSSQASHSLPQAPSGDLDGAVVSQVVSSSVDRPITTTLTNQSTTQPSLRPLFRRGHSRSISNPFPSLFSGRKKESRKEKDPICESEESETDPLPQSSPLAARSASPLKRNGSGDNTEEFIRQHCMTCGHTNAFPKETKGFRCGKCTTMNDLEPYRDSRLKTLTPDEQFQLDKQTPWKVTIEDTQSIIDQCLSLYIRTQLNELKQGRVSSPRIPRRSQDGDTCQQEDPARSNSIPSHDSLLSPAEANDRLKPPGSTTAHRRTGELKSRSPSASEGSPALTSDHGMGELSLDTQGTTGSKRIDPSVEMRRAPNIFHSLEVYIIACFDKSDILNNSFLTGRSHSARAASEGFQATAADEDIEVRPSTTALQQAPVSALDEKTLLLGNIAENGSWWTGNHPARHRSTNAHRSIKNIANKPNLVSSRSPRINWSELSQWYNMVLHAGESWYQAMKKITGDSPEATLLESKELAHLNEEIMESQLHLRKTLLRSTERLLQRPKRPLVQPSDVRFLLMILENPLLYSSSMIPKSQSASKISISNNTRPSKSPTRPVSRVPSASRAHRTIPASRSTGIFNHRYLVLKRTFGLLSNLPNECHHFLVSWLFRTSEDHLRRLVELVNSFITYRLSRVHKKQKNKPKASDDIGQFVPTFSSPGAVTAAQLHTALQRDSDPKCTDDDKKFIKYGDDWQIRAASRVMALLFRANSTRNIARSNPLIASNRTDSPEAGGTNEGRIAINFFYNTRLDYVDLILDFETWESRGRSFSFCQYSFFLSIWAKIRILEYDARRQMEAKAREAFFDTILGKSPVSQYLVLKVRRDCLVEDSLQTVSEAVGSGPENIKKGLRVEFAGEEGIDAGGLRKEWFLLLVREVFDPHHGLFLYDEDSQSCYFNPHCFESSEQFFLVGVVLGLAIYNSTILDVALPPFAFRKLLASAPSSTSPSLSSPAQPFRPTLGDLAEYRPALAKGLRQLLEHDGNVEETFCYDFMVQVERYGEQIQVPLCHGGESRPVTNANRREFVDLYVKYLLDNSVSRQFEPFKRGFYTVCGGNALQLFKPEEIELLVRGSEEPLEIQSLKAVAIYEHWQVPSPEREPVVRWFWNFFERLSPGDQRKMLSFITGSDRIPAMGAINLVIRFNCLGEDCERFPIARTCFNMIGLYRYRTREKLESRLWRAVLESEGFGLK